MRIICIVAAVFLVSACSQTSSSSGAASSSRVPMTANDQKAVAMLGGFGGDWLRHTQDIIRVNGPAPEFATYAVAFRSKCREAFTVYAPTRDLPVSRLADIFVHEAQHHYDKCMTGPKWEDRANAAMRCWQQGTSRDSCNLPDA